MNLSPDFRTKDQETENLIAIYKFFRIVLCFTAVLVCNGLKQWALCIKPWAAKKPEMHQDLAFDR